MSLERFVSCRLSRESINVLTDSNLHDAFPFSDGVMLEISLVHEGDINWFITQDETHHQYDTVGHKGGSTATRWANNSFPRSGEHVIENSTHTTGVYGYTFAGEPLPPL